MVELTGTGLSPADVLAVAREGLRTEHVRLVSPSFGVVERRGWGPGRSGNHDDRAWALMVPGSARERTRDRPPDVVDIAATVCALLGLDASGIVGEPLLERP